MNNSNNTLPKPHFLTNDQGHLLRRRPDAPSSFPIPESAPSKTSFSFSPVGYISHQVKPSTVLIGVRGGGMNQTNPQAHHYLKKDQNQSTLQFSCTRGLNKF